MWCVALPALRILTFGQFYIKSNNGKPVRINDVAEVVIGSAPKMGYASGNAKPAIIISISKQPNANTLAVTQRIEENLLVLQKTLPKDVKWTPNFPSGRFY